MPHIEFDGRPATEEDLRIPALYGYGHFTALQVRDGRTRGLAPHLARLDAANRELFELPLEGDRGRELVRHALDCAGRRDAAGRPSVRRPVTPEGPDRVGRYRSAFVCNSQGIAPVRRIDGTGFTVDEELMRDLGGVYDSAPEDTV